MVVYCSLHHENPDGSAFCDECGEPLASATPDPTAVASPAASSPAPAAGMQTCPSCGTPNPAGEAFCSNFCATILGTPAPAAVKATAATASPEPRPMPDA